MVEVDLDLTGDWGAENWQMQAERAVVAAFASAGFAPRAPISLSISLSDNETVQALNAQWRGKDKPTNVLSFPMLEREELVALIPPRHGEVAAGTADGGGAMSQASLNAESPLHHASHGPPPRSGEVLLGDIILAYETCAAEAAQKGISLADHVTHLIVHGTLHLLGYDHIDDGEAEHMEALEVKALASLGIANPY